MVLRLILAFRQAPVRNAQGNIKAVMGVVDDVTERKRTQAVEALFYEIDQFVLQGHTLDFILSHLCKCLVLHYS